MPGELDADFGANKEQLEYRSVERICRENP